MGKIRDEMAEQSRYFRSFGGDYRELPLETRRELTRHSTFSWMLNHRPNYFRPFWHTLLADRELDRCFSGDPDYRHLLISMPPRLGKTEVSLRYGATRYLALNPTHHVWVVTYNTPTAKQFGYQAKQIFLHNAEELYGLKVERRRSANDHWEVAGHGGGFHCIGWGGGISGHEVDLLIIDDLVKDSVEVSSQRRRDTLWEWVDSTAMQRVEDSEMKQTKLFVIGTQWHTDDHINRLMQAEEQGTGVAFQRLVLPAWAERGPVKYQDEVLLDQHEVLCEARLPKTQILKIKRSRSRKAYEALYLCDPTQADGSQWGSELFGQEIWVTELPRREHILGIAVGLDPATGKDMKRGDYTAIVALIATIDQEFYVAADLERQGGYRTTQRLLEFCQSLPIMPDWIGIESNGFQALLASDAEHVFDEIGAKTFVQEIENTGPRANKADRIHQNLDPVFHNRDFRFLRSRGCHLLIQQARSFPTGEYDDGLDALEMAAFGMNEAILV